MSTSKPSAPSQVALSTANGNLIGLLTVGFYVLFTLLPSSHSLMVSWPWVAMWQVTLALPMIWLLWQLWFKPLEDFRLGSGLDWPMAILGMGLVVSTLFAEFPNQARWYSWAALGGIAAVYALSGWLKTSHQALRLLKFQALVGITFILVSLGLWLSQTYFSELQRLAELEPYGVSQQFNFGITSLRNWYPIGHQNYVAGYLVLILPLLLALAITEKGWQRWLWGSGCCLGLVDLYTASSRGGLLALVVTVAIALAVTLFRSPLPRRIILPTGGVLLLLLLAVTFGNSRVRRPLLALLEGRTNNSELGYRIITNTIGWHMGLDHPLTGIGPGGVLQLYQKYRPYWAGREAELHFQLHSTPAQLWAELGVWGMAALLSMAGLLGWLTWRWSSRPFHYALNAVLVWSLIASLFAFSLMGLTDYQLDVIPISGTLVIYLAVLAQVYQTVSPASGSPRVLAPSSRFLRLAVGLGCFIAVNLWLVPVHRAWAISKQGFDQLNRGDFNGFEIALTQAHQLAPWEPYYSSILAWTAGDFSFQTSGSSSDTLKTSAVDWFETANRTAPYSEFSRTNLGWLLLQTQPEQAIRQFSQACQLVPGKQGVFLGLGLALLANNQDSLAVDALVLEILRSPIVMTSPLWQVGALSGIRNSVFSQLEQQYTNRITHAQSPLTEYWKQMRGTLYWWQGQYDQAAVDWQNFSTGQALLSLAQSEPLTADSLSEALIARNAMLAWLQPENRRFLLERAAIKVRDQLPQLNEALPESTLVEQWVTTMEQADSFDDWLKNNNLIAQPRNQRLGFGTLNRHIDGHLPVDFYTQVLNQPISQFFASMFPSMKWRPELDMELQPDRERLLQQISPK